MTWRMDIGKRKCCLRMRVFIINTTLFAKVVRILVRITRSFSKAGNKFNQNKVIISTKIKLKMQPLQYMPRCVLILCSLSCLTALNVVFNTTQRVYNVGDNVTLTCYVKPGWLTVTLKRENTDIFDCFSIPGRCVPVINAPGEGRYIPTVNDANLTLLIKHVTEYDSVVTFTCQWTSFTDTVSFYIQDTSVSTTTFTSTKENELNILTILGVVGFGLAICLVAITVIACVLQKKNVIRRYQTLGNRMDTLKKTHPTHEDEMNNLTEAHEEGLKKLEDESEKEKQSSETKTLEDEIAKEKQSSETKEVLDMKLEDESEKEKQSSETKKLEDEREKENNPVIPNTKMVINNAYEMTTIPKEQREKGKDAHGILK